MIILKILLGIDLFLAIASMLFIVLSIVSDLINTNNPNSFTKDVEAELRGHSGARILAGVISSLCWSIFIMCVI
jgi:hypothetical protein